MRTILLTALVTAVSCIFICDPVLGQGRGNGQRGGQKRGFRQSRSQKRGIGKRGVQKRGVRQRGDKERGVREVDDQERGFRQRGVRRRGGQGRGIGWLVSQAAKNGIRGRQLAEQIQVFQAIQGIGMMKGFGPGFAGGFGGL